MTEPNRDPLLHRYRSDLTEQVAVELASPGQAKTNGLLPVNDLLNRTKVPAGTLRFLAQSLVGLVVPDELGISKRKNSPLYL